MSTLPSPESKLSDARVHLDDFGRGGAPAGSLRAKCGVILGERNPRIVQSRAAVTCSACLAGLRSVQEGK